jgi:hypothetical protein
MTEETDDNNNSPIALTEYHANKLRDEALAFKYMFDNFKDAFFSDSAESYYLLSCKY